VRATQLPAQSDKADPTPFGFSGLHHDVFGLSQLQQTLSRVVLAISSSVRISYSGSGLLLCLNEVFFAVMVGILSKKILKCQCKKGYDCENSIGLLNGTQEASQNF
jgi:hypothetical protein